MDTERNLLFGVVALQNGAVDADNLAETCTAWASEPTLALADVMVDRGFLTVEQRTELEATVARELASHGDDPGATLAATIDGRSLEALGGVVVASAAGGSASGSPSSPSAMAIASIPPVPGDGPAQAGHVVLGRLSPGEADARDRYTLTHLHAKGGMGRVWLARDGSLGRQIALKELRPDQADNSIVCSRFLYEAKITAQLEHPGIVPVYELGDGDAPYYTMRFVRGRTLTEAIRAYHKKRAAGEADSVALNDLLLSLISACHAVDYAHSRGIIHRDLKGQNVVLGDFGEVIVLDWGLAKRVGPDPSVAPSSSTPDATAGQFDPDAATAATRAAAPSALDDDLTTPGDAGAIVASYEADPDATAAPTAIPGTNGHHAAVGSGSGSGHSSGQGVPESGAGPEGTMQGQLLGTPAYMAPEQARARHDLVDQRTDIYGLGAILYEILAGRPPFVAPRTSEVIKKVINEEPTPPRQIIPEVPPALEAICLKALRKAKPDRYQTAGELATELRRYLADEPVRAFAEPWTLRAQRWARRNRTKVAAAAAGLVIATIALAASTVLVTRERNEAEAQGEQARQAVHLLAKGADIAFDDQLDPVQKEMLQDALAYYKQFTGRASNDPAVRLEHGHALQLMGDIERKLGHLEESEKSYLGAIEKLEGLAGAVGDVGREARRRLARTRTLLGDLKVRRGAKKDEVTPLYASAMEAQQLLAVAKRDPAAAPEDILRLGQTYRSRAYLLRLVGELGEAEATYTLAVAELERAIAAGADRPEATAELSLALAERGLTRRDRGDAPAAEADYRRAVEMAEKLVAEFPTVPRHREALADSCNYLGWIEQEAGRIDDAEKHLRREVALDRRLAEDYPDRTEYRRMLARGLTDFGTVLKQRGQVAEADPALREAITLDAAIAAASPDDVRVRHQLAIAHHSLGQVQMAQGDNESAAGSFAAARAINEDLARKHPETPRYRSTLADNLDSQALVLARLNRPGVDEAFLAAAAIYDGLVAAHPDNAQYVINRTISMRNRGAVLAEAGRSDPAAEVLRRALASLDAGPAHDRSPEWRRAQTSVLINLGTLEVPEAEDVLRRAIAIGGPLNAAGKAAAADDRYQLAIAHNNLGDLLVKRKRAAEAGRQFAEAVDRLEALVADAPRSMDYQNVLAIVLDGQADWFVADGRPAEAKGALTAAVEHQREAVKLSKNAPACRKALAGHLIKLADVNRKLGAYDQAAKTALEVPRTVPTADRPLACFDAARALARLVAQVGADIKVPQAERDHLARTNLTRTVVLLREAVDADPKLADPIKADRDLKVLESRPEFQAILNTLVEASR